MDSSTYTHPTRNLNTLPNKQKVTPGTLPEKSSYIFRKETNIHKHDIRITIYQKDKQLASSVFREMDPITGGNTARKKWERT